MVKITFGLVYLVAFCCCFVGAQLVDETDTKVLAQAASSTSLFCGQPVRGTLIGSAEGTAALTDAAGGTNLVQTILYGTPQSQLASKAQTTLTGSTLVAKAAAVAFSIIMATVWFICCWTCCPCCRCCRCCEKHRTTHPITKSILSALILGLAVGIIICFFMALRGYNATVNGFNIMTCSMAGLVNTTLGGSPDFIGMIPTLTTISTLVGQLNNGSFFITNVTGVLAKTQPVSDAVAVLTEVTDMLQEMTSLPDNVVPKLLNGSSKHVCTFCQNLGAKLTPVGKAITNGFGSALANVQTQINTQLSPASRQKQINNLQPTLDALKAAKVTVRNAGGFFINKDQFGQIKSYLDGPVQIAVVCICIAGIVLVVFGLIAMMVFVCCEKKGNYEEPNQHVFRLACCTWCCSWWYAVIVFLIGGIMIIVAVPLSGMCLILAGLNGDTLRQMGPAIGMDLSNNSSQLAISLINGCLAGGAGQNANILKILTVNGTSVYDTMVTNVTAPIIRQFANLDSASPSLNMASNPDLSNLTSILNNYTTDAMTTPDTTFASDSTWGGRQMTGDRSLFEAAQATSLSCFNQTTGANFNSITTKGLSTFISQFNAKYGNGVASGVSICGTAVQGCKASLTTPQLAVCNGATTFLGLKQQLLTSSNAWRCDVWQDASGNPCNMSSMTQTAGVWTGDCILPVGTPGGRFKRVTKTCSMQEFAAYIKNYANLINQAAARVDSSAMQVQSTIKTGLRTLVTQYLTGPITSVANGATCGFMGVQYNEFINGLCYQTTWGFINISNSYIACAALATVLVALMYGVWRRALDNSWSAVAVAPKGKQVGERERPSRLDKVVPHPYSDMEESGRHAHDRGRSSRPGHRVSEEWNLGSVGERERPSRLDKVVPHPYSDVEESGRHAHDRGRSSRPGHRVVPQPYSDVEESGRHAHDRGRSSRPGHRVSEEWKLGSVGRATKVAAPTRTRH